MQISARNQISGIVELITNGTVNAEVYIKLKSGHTIVSVITNTAVNNLDLNLGDEVVAIFKSYRDDKSAYYYARVMYPRDYSTGYNDWCRTEKIRKATKEEKETVEV